LTFVHHKFEQVYQACFFIFITVGCRQGLVCPKLGRFLVGRFQTPFAKQQQTGRQKITKTLKYQQETGRVAVFLLALFPFTILKPD